jgi:SAM-dependent methyltransferase
MLDILKHIVYQTARFISWPLRYYFGRSFDRVHDHMARQQQYLLSRLEALERHVAEHTAVTVAERLPDAEVLAEFFAVHRHTLHKLTAQVETIERRLEESERRLAERLPDAEVLAEFFAVHRHTLLRLAAQLEAVERRLGEVATHTGQLPALGAGLAELRDQAGRLPQLDQRLAEVAARSADLAAQTLVNRSLQELGEGAAELLNYANSHRGFAAQAGLWINHPVVLSHHSRGVEVDQVNERIVELPYVLSALASLPIGSHILDFGATESLLALYLASLGYHVVALDQRPYPFCHPRLRIVTCLAEEWTGPTQPFDAIVSLSTLEHVGLGHYGDRRADLDLDRQLVQRFRRWLQPDGRLILTAPYGAWNVDELQRTYDADHLAALLDGWDIVNLRYAVRVSPRQWDVVEQEPPASLWWSAETCGVVLLQAKPRP